MTEPIKPEPDYIDFTKYVMTPRAIVAAEVISLAWRYSTRWPWSEEQYNRLVTDPDRLLHAAAILCAAQDVIDAERAEGK